MNTKKDKQRAIKRLERAIAWMTCHDAITNPSNLVEFESGSSLLDYHEIKEHKSTKPRDKVCKACLFGTLDYLNGFKPSGSKPYELAYDMTRTALRELYPNEGPFTIASKGKDTLIQIYKRAIQLIKKS